MPTGPAAVIRGHTRLWALIGLCLAWQLAASSPVIQRATLASDQTVILEGSGFGVGPSTSRVWDDSASAPAYRGIPIGAPVPVSALAPFSGSNGTVLFSNAVPRTASRPRHFRTHQFEGSLGYPAALGGKSPPAHQRQIYVSFFFRPDSPIDIPGHSSKFVRIWDDHNGRGTRISWTQMHLTYINSSDSLVSWGGWKGSAGAWNRLEVFVDADAGVIKTWTNGRPIHSVQNFRKDPGFVGVGLTTGLVGWNTGGGSPPKIDASFTEIYIDSTQARVELCTTESWSACIQRELQISSDWSDQRIAFRLDRGSLPEGTPVYAFVIDRNGKTSERGALIKLPATTKPKTPNSVSVN